MNDYADNGTESNSLPTFAWKTVTEVRVENGLIFMITGDAKGLHGEFWFENDEQLVVIRYPETASVTTSENMANSRQKKTQSG